MLPVTPATGSIKVTSTLKLGVDRLSAWLIIGTDIYHFSDYQHLWGLFFLSNCQQNEFILKCANLALLQLRLSVCAGKEKCVSGDWSTQLVALIYYNTS